jgi:gas vesicle protein
MLDKQRLRTLVLGGAIGALAGILLAPKSGKELRGSIASRTGEARERSRETYFEAQERMRERVSRARERPFSSREIRTGEASAEGLPTLGAGVPEPILDPETPVEPPPLRDVSWEAPSWPASGEDPEELRRRIRETRSRLRAHLDTPEDTPTPRDRDE